MAAGQPVVCTWETILRNVWRGLGRYDWTTVERRGQEPSAGVSASYMSFIHPGVFWPPLEKLLVPSRILSCLGVKHLPV